MFRYRQVFLWLLSLVFCCCTPQDIKREVASFELPLKLSPLEITFDSYEKLYYYRHYHKIVQGGFPHEKGAESEYLYFRSLYHLKEWDNLLFYQKYANLKSPYYPYIAFYQLQALVAREHYQLAYETFLQWEELLEKNPFQDEINDLFEEILAALKLEQESGNPGRYYYYRYLRDKKREDLVKSLSLKDLKALALIHDRNFKQILSAEQWSPLLPWVIEQKPHLAWKICVFLGKKEEAGRLLFQKKKYSKALRLLPANSKLSVLARLALGRGRIEDEKQVWRETNSFFYLANQFLRQKRYQELLSLYENKYEKGFLRESLIGMFKNKRQDLLKRLLEILWKKKAQLEESEYQLVLYYQGIFQKNKDFWKELVIRFPNSFYGSQALEEWGKPERWLRDWKELFKQNDDRAENVINQWKKSEFQEQHKQALFFLKIGEHQKGFALLRKQVGSLTPYYVSLLRFFKALERTDLVIYFGRTVYDEIAQVCGNRLFYVDLMHEIFPVKFQNLIHKVSQEYDLDNYLILAMVRQESRFEVTARSRVGASGLFQVMPKTAAPILKSLMKKELIVSTSLFDPWTNLLVGGNFLNWLWDKVYKDYPGAYRKILTVASYNAGPRRLKKLYASFEGKDYPTLYIESIPFKETRGYVKAVLLYERIYKFLKSLEQKKD